MKEAIIELISRIKSKDYSSLDSLKRQISKKYKLNKFPSNIDILEHLDESNKEIFKNLLLSKPVRTLSGVAPIAVMTKPIACAHGKCTFCPGGPKSNFGDVPQSYTGNEPSTMRAIRSNYDPYLIVFNRIEQYILLNHIPDKAEIIIQGGTFCSFPKEYQDEVVIYILKAMNDFSEMFFTNDKLDFDKFKDFFELPGSVKDKERGLKIADKILKFKGTSNVEKEQLRNETSKIRSTALVIETKPDWCMESEINEILKLGTTRVELGIQTLKEDVLKATNRGHTLNDSIKSIQLLKDSFLKTTLHMMPGLPNTSRDEDINMFKELFSNQNYRPDGLKIYPCIVMPGTPLYIQYKNRLFTPLTTEKGAEIIAECKKFIENYCRVYRVNRDIPTKVTEAGIGHTNLRQFIDKELIKKNIKCKCIRCREPMGKEVDYDSVEIKKQYYDSSNGKEVFISIIDSKNDILLGFCRLRKPYKPFRPEITSTSAGIRELHVYGQATPIGEEGIVQHRGYGKKLMEEAEKIAKEEWNCDKMLVISGIGVKEYYKKLGYSKDSVYMSKKL
ncbi:tRNA uridine(34) 5-carboxymethylaminomethyl modification radical SAM/GNAT enzyme Elp3 [Candidatus Woesearchaeota archaeon]|nr:MAG: elongator complex protein 3 [archaeon GW2011_AR18]MBS3161140.1 tRNA uridine(34) 5-carboxymethylaminomethyl modification radical SAM/GNAT enzyme Elp3 [Candidatus Woesearchaeota archaeon]HIH26369.1 tRNA uridine(34) 5-carboxymethylaminomethyl modification radical SAM/GNAT enzyme Elp3 [Nanoarchaeota archaeon]